MFENMGEQFAENGAQTLNVLKKFLSTAIFFFKKAVDRIYIYRHFFHIYSPITDPQIWSLKNSVPKGPFP